MDLVLTSCILSKRRGRGDLVLIFSITLKGVPDGVSFVPKRTWYYH